VRPRQALCQWAFRRAPYRARRVPASMHNRAPLGPHRKLAGLHFSPPIRRSMATFPLTHRLKRLRILDSLGSARSLGFWLVNDEMKAPRFSSIELKVEGMARRKANRQLLRVPWGRFRRAYDEYPRWQALALWGELLAGTGPADNRPFWQLSTSSVPASSSGAHDYNNPCLWAFMFWNGFTPRNSIMQSGKAGSTH
jgi:hypothetical protein